MDEPTPNTTTLGRRLLAARTEAGMTTDDVIDALKAALPRHMVMSRTKLNQLEKGHVAKPDPFDVELLAAVYGREVRDLSESIADDLERVRRFVLIRGGDDGGSPGSPCTPTSLLRTPVSAGSGRSKAA
jgi:transcriptional regulator with XRE-family HTH domain